MTRISHARLGLSPFRCIRRPRRLSTAAVIAGLCLLFTGCSFGSEFSPEATTCDPLSETPNCFVPISFGQMIDEWERTAHELDVPPGVVLQEPTSSRFGGGTQTFEPGYGALLAHESWFCSWQQAWLESIDAVTTQRAMEQMQAFLLTDSYIRNHRENPATRRILDDAANGDREPLEKLHMTTCEVPPSG